MIQSITISIDTLLSTLKYMSTESFIHSVRQARQYGESNIVIQVNENTGGSPVITLGKQEHTTQSMTVSINALFSIVKKISTELLIDALEQAQACGESDVVIQVNEEMKNIPIIIRGKQKQTLIYHNRTFLNI